MNTFVLVRFAPAFAMLETLVYRLLLLALLGFMAAFMGRYVGRSPLRYPASPDTRRRLVAQVWGVTALAALAFGFTGHLLKLQPYLQIGFTGFLLPLIFGSYFCRELLKYHMDKQG